MRALDTSVLARVFLDDDQEQREMAERLPEGPVLLLPTVILELARVLRSRGRWAHPAIAEVLLQLTEMPHVDCRDARAVR